MRCLCGPEYWCSCGGCYVHDHARGYRWDESMGEDVQWFWYGFYPWMGWHNNGCFHRALPEDEERTRFRTYG